MGRFWLITALLVIMPLGNLVHAKNSFLVAPGRVSFDLNKPSTESFIITNNGDDKIRLSIKPIYFEIHDKALNLGNHLDESTAGIEDLTPFLRVSPRTLSLAPGQKRNIRISLRPPKDLGDGDYRTHLLVSMLETSQVIKTEKSDNPDALGMELSIKMETGVAVFGKKGTPAPVLEVGCEKDAEQGTVTLAVTNRTAWRFDGSVKLFAADQTAAKPVVDEYIVSYRGSVNPIETQWAPTQKGTYNIEWAHSDDETIRGTGSCEIP